MTTFCVHLPVPTIIIAEGNSLTEGLTGVGESGNQRRVYLASKAGCVLGIYDR